MISIAARRRIKAFLPRTLIDQLVLLESGAQAFRAMRGRHPRECAICGYQGMFWAAGQQPLVFDSECPKCRSVGRHRQHHLLMERHPDWLDGRQVLHFAPEPCFDDRYARRLRATGGTYVRAEYTPTNGETRVDLLDMQFDDASFDTIIVHNVLEHVKDDHRALTELARVVKPDGRVILSVPMLDAWEHTLEDPSITSERERDLYFNQEDHLRLYGRDFRDRLTRAGFDYTAYVAMEPEVSRYGLERGETIFICTPRPT
jgi:SAM-dependent methyltransferase